MLCISLIWNVGVSGLNLLDTFGSAKTLDTFQSVKTLDTFRSVKHTLKNPRYISVS